MANNTMILVHRPSGKAVKLGKRMAHGWYGVPENLAANIQALFDEVEPFFGDDGFCEYSEAVKTLDDFVLMLDDVTHAPKTLQYGRRTYTDSNPIWQLELPLCAT